jgi:hypothetical protein
MTDVVTYELGHVVGYSGEVQHLHGHLSYLHNPDVHTIVPVQPAAEGLRRTGCGQADSLLDLPPGLYRLGVERGAGYTRQHLGTPWSLSVE